MGLGVIVCLQSVSEVQIFQFYPVSPPLETASQYETKITALQAERTQWRSGMPVATNRKVLHRCPLLPTPQPPPSPVCLVSAGSSMKCGETF